MTHVAIADRGKRSAFLDVLRRKGGAGGRRDRRQLRPPGEGRERGARDNRNRHQRSETAPRPPARLAIGASIAAAAI